MQFTQFYHRCGFVKDNKYLESNMPFFHFFLSVLRKFFKTKKISEKLQNLGNRLKKLGLRKKCSKHNLRMVFEKF